MSADMLMIDFKKINASWERLKKMGSGWDAEGYEEALFDLGIVACEHEGEDDGHCRDCNNRGWVSR